MYDTCTMYKSKSHEFGMSKWIILVKLIIYEKSFLKKGRFHYLLFLNKNQQEQIWLNTCECVRGCSSLRSLCLLSWWERFAESVSLRALDTTNNREEWTIQYSNNDSRSNTFNNTPEVLSFSVFNIHIPGIYSSHITLFFLFLMFIYLSLSLLLFFLLWNIPLYVPVPWGVSQ